MIDFHAHLDLYQDPLHVVQGCRERNLYVLSVTNTPSAWAGTSRLVRPTDRIRTALGLHPELAKERKSELDLFAELLPQVRYVGEIGLDGCPGPRKFWSDQLMVFKEILDACSREGGRVLSIHSRRAAAPVLDCLEQHPSAGVPVLHWFSGSGSELRRAVELGCWFSVGPAMTRSKKGQGLIARMPRDRVLTETDGPFSEREGRPMMPWDVKDAVNDLAAIWGVAGSEVQDGLRANLRQLAALASVASSPANRQP